MFQLYNQRVTVDKGDWFYIVVVSCHPKGYIPETLIKRTAIMSTEIGDRIAQLRRARDLSLRQLAEVSGISHNQIHKYEKGISVPNRDTVVALAKIFNVKPTWLLFGRDIDATELDSIQESFDALREGGKQMIRDNIQYLLSVERAEEKNGEQ